MVYYVGVDPDHSHQRIDRVCIILHHPDFYRILTGKQIHFDFNDQMGAVASTGLNGYYIVRKLQCRVINVPQMQQNDFGNLNLYTSSGNSSRMPQPHTRLQRPAPYFHGIKH